MFNFPTRIPDRDSHSPALLDLFLLTLVFFLQQLSLFWKNSNCVVSVSIDFLQTQKGTPLPIAQLVTILVWIGKVFVIILETFHGRVALNSVLLQLLMNFVSSRLELMCVSFIVSNLIHLSGLQLLVLLHRNNFFALKE